MLTERVLSLKSSPTLALAAKGRELKAQGFDVVSLAVGEPDWDSFEIAKKEAIQSIQDGFSKYVPSSGIEELKDAIAKDVNKDLGTQFLPSQVTVTSGGKFSIYALLQSLIQKGDEVLIPAPYWVSYPDMTELAEGTPVILPTDESSDFKIRPQDLESKISSKTKLLILNSPSNPTGSVYTHEELVALAQVLKKHPQIYIMSDDIYNKLTFEDGPVCAHILQADPSLTPRTIIINGGSKAYAMTGWRIGWAIGPQEIIGAMTKFQSQTVSCANSFTQKATAKVIREGEADLKRVRSMLLERKNFAVQEINKIPGIHVFDPQGAFYLWVNIQSAIGKSFEGKRIEGSRDFAHLFLESQKVIAVPGLEFGMEGFIRFSFALEQPRMKLAFERLGQFVESLSS